MDETRVAVIVGVGQVNDRSADLDTALDSLSLAEAALRAAEADAGARVLTDLQSLAVVDQISMPELGPIAAPLAQRVGASPQLCYQAGSPSGDGPVRLLNEAVNRIAAGEIEVAAVAGGEALRTGAHRAAARGAEPNATRRSSQARAPDERQRYGLVAPVDVYPLYENATRAAWGQSLDEAQSESGHIWSQMSEVAAANEDAWIRTPKTSAEIVTSSAANRPIAFPYTKLMVANSSVNQGAAFIVTSLARARRHGIPESRMVYVGRGAAAHEAGNPLKRDRYDHAPAMTASLQQAMSFNGLALSDLDLVELYSCFPCIPKMARRVLGWPLARPATVFGGLTFGGGPIGNYMAHAVVAMVQRLRDEGRLGLLFANGGLVTHSHTLPLGREPFGSPGPASFDVQAEADRLRGPIPSQVEAYSGRGHIETYTVLYGRTGAARFGVVVGRSPDGSRFLAKMPGDDARAMAFLTDGVREPVGTAGRAELAADGTVYWTPEL